MSRDRDGMRQPATETTIASDAVVARARAWLREAERVVVFTGAGVSAESGIATFRDALTGLWARFDPQALATEAGFRADPALVWRWYAERRAAVAKARPNARRGAADGSTSSRRTWTACTAAPAVATCSSCTATSRG